MHIIQITDTHLPSSAGEFVTGIDTLSRCKRLINHLKNENADLLIVTGDISFDVENYYCYESLKKILNELPYPWLVLPGNHDRGDIFKEVFSDKGINKFTVLKAKGDTPLLFFDSSSEKADNHQLNELEKYLLNSSNENYIFTHYPPITVSHPSYDNKHSLNWRKQFLKALTKSKAPMHCFFGHIHFVHEQKIDHLHFYSTPSATLPSIQGIGTDYPDERGCFYRNILINTSGIETTVNFIPYG